jgi:predicted PilT family ATPase
MGLHEIKKLLHNKRNGLYIEEITYRVEEDNRKLKKLNSPKINELIRKWASELNRTFSKEEVQLVKKHMKKFSPYPTIKKMQIKTTLRFHLTPVRIAIIKNITDNRC